MKLLDLQCHLKATNRYAGALDALPGKLTDAGILLAMTDGPDTQATDQDFKAISQKLQVQVCAIKAFWLTEAQGVAFVNGRAPILPERHRFSKLTNHIFDEAYPQLSQPKWDRHWYPTTQDARWDVILQWVRLLAHREMPIDAAFAAVSYGAPQILGENYSLCGFTSPFQMAEAMARDERTQLEAFAHFVTKAGILPYLRKVNRNLATIQPVVQRYNGTAYKLNKYDVRYQANLIKCGG
jgi:hypothetical protein